MDFFRNLLTRSKLLEEELRKVRKEKDQLVNKLQQTDEQFAKAQVLIASQRLTIITTREEILAYQQRLERSEKCIQDIHDFTSGSKWFPVQVIPIVENLGSEASNSNV